MVNFYGQRLFKEVLLPPTTENQNSSIVEVLELVALVLLRSPREEQCTPASAMHVNGSDYPFLPTTPRSSPLFFDLPARFRSMETSK